MTKFRMNRWPDQADRPDLWTHSLEDLANILGINPKSFDPTDAAAAAWKMTFEWHRGHGYASNKLSLKFSEQMYEAAFGSDGVVEWLSKRYRLNI